MNTLKTILLILAVVGLCVTGIDLSYSRTGPALVILGVFLMGSVFWIREKESQLGWPDAIFVLIIGGYFIARGSSPSVPAFSIADGVLVITAAGVFIATRILQSQFQVSLIYGFLGFAIVNVAIGFWQKANDGSGYIFRDGILPDWAMTGFFGHYNVFAAATNAAFFLLLSGGVFSSSQTRRGIFIGGALCCAVAIALCGSRGGWLSLIAGGATFLALWLIELRRSQNKLFGLVLVGGLIVVTAGVIFVGDKLQDTYEGRVGTREVHPIEKEGAKNDGGRLIYQQWAFDFFLRSPAVGNGPRSFEYLSVENWDADDLWYNQADPDFVHNEALQVLADYGGIGFFLLLAMIFSCGVRGLARYLDQQEQSSQWLRCGSLAALVAILTQSFVSFLFHTSSLLVIIMLLLACLYGDARNKSSGRVVETFTALIAGSATLLIGVALTMSSWAYFQAPVFRAGGLNLREWPTLNKAIKLSGDSALAERVGVRAHQAAVISHNGNDLSAFKLFGTTALEAFELALEYNPRSLLAISTKARLLDELGRPEEARPFHAQAIERGPGREYFLKPLYFAARNRILLATKAFTAKDERGYEKYLLEAQEFLAKRRELIAYEGAREVNEMREQVRASLAHLWGPRLYFEGDQRWKKRDAEGGYGLMLEARQYYLKSRNIAEKSDPLWFPQWEQLNQNITILKGAGIKPQEFSEEEIRRIATRGVVGLDQFDHSE